MDCVLLLLARIIFSTYSSRCSKFFFHLQHKSRDQLNDFCHFAVNNRDTEFTGGDRIDEIIFLFLPVLFDCLEITHRITL